MFRASTLVILTCSSLIAASASPGESKSMGAYWRESGIAIKDLTAYVNAENCRKSIENFFGCKSALEALGTRGLESLPSNGDLRAQRLADAINAYLGAAKDPHTYIVPRAWRQPVSNPNVTWRMVSDHGAPVGYIRLRTLEDPNACASVRDAIEGVKKTGVATGLVLDLRDNPGGAVEQATCVAGLFLGPWHEIAFLYAKDLVVNVLGFDVVQHYADYRYFPQISSEPQATELPLVVLVNAHTASASEILAGALQDYQRAILIGSRTYGKGTYQQPRELPTNPKIVLMETGGRFFLPTKRTNQIVGVLPDVEVHKDLKALREADLYTNAFPPQGEPWKQPRPHEIAALKKCMDGFEAHSRDVAARDYQLFSAETALRCLSVR